MSLKRPGEQGPSGVHARKIRVVETSPKRHTGSIAPIAPQIADFSETLREVPAFNSMLMVVGDTPEAATDKLKRVVDLQAEAELREWNQAHYVLRELATKVFRMMGIHMTLLYHPSSGCRSPPGCGSPGYLCIFDDFELYTQRNRPRFWDRI
ncbi:hypothetical protein BGX38DRAFT_1261338 [Terfezia claveryi]|nr:hypothetical protein BGX38DRAFT_1261338 [Terfezia claveryi]